MSSEINNCQMLKEQPLVFDIRRASTVDGPGLRTTVFLKGCNLNCAWCHNPEGKSPDIQIAFFKEKCISCGVCRTVCPNPQFCTACVQCVQQCPAGARKLYGKYYTSNELIEIIRADKPYYDATGGGVTFSGGECMLYPIFLSDLTSQCRVNGISVAIDTAGAVHFSAFEKVLAFTDLFLFDIKCMDPALHKKGTGSDNQLILENLQKLRKYGKNILIRIPCIPGFNEGAEVKAVQQYCEQLHLTYEVLHYHPWGESKRRALVQKKN